MNVLLSIKPKFANAILDGIKKIEFRKQIFKNEEISKIYLYSSSPEQKIIGYFTYKQIIKENPSLLWDEFGEVGYISQEDFFNYFEGKSKGYGILVDKVNRFKTPIEPKEIFDKFTPPQSFKYLESNILT